MAKTFYIENTNADGGRYLNTYPSFVTAPPTVAFDLDRELEIAGRLRTPTEAGIARQMRSYEIDGEFQPVLIRVFPKKDSRERKVHGAVPRLIDGETRIGAGKRLGLKSIAAWFVECDDDEAKSMEIAANLHRTELTPAQSGQQMIEWCRLHDLPLPDKSDAGGDEEPDAVATEAPGADPVNWDTVTQFSEPSASQRPRGGRGHKGAAAKAAEAFGVSKKTAVVISLRRVERSRRQSLVSTSTEPLPARSQSRLPRRWRRRPGLRSSRRLRA